MHDAASVEWTDTVIVDVEQHEPMAVGRAPTEDLVMHVKLEDDDHPSGLWHREVTYQITACERKVPLTGVQRRPQKYDASDCDYCPGCFFPYEIRLARATARAELELLEEDFEESVAERRRSSPRVGAGDLIDRSRRRSQRIEAHLIQNPEKKDDMK